MDESHPLPPTSRAACPHLGMVDESGAHLDRPSDRHCCFAHDAADETISHRHQAQFCLVAEWPACYKLQPGFIPVAEEAPAPGVEAEVEAAPIAPATPGAELSLAARRLLDYVARREGAPPPRPLASPWEERHPFVSRTGALFHRLQEQPRNARVLGVLAAIPLVLLVLATGMVSLGATAEEQAESEATIAPGTQEVQTAQYPDLLVRATAATGEFPAGRIEPTATFPPLEVEADPEIKPVNIDLPPPEALLGGEQGEQSGSPEGGNPAPPIPAPPLPWPAQAATSAPERIWAPSVGMDAPVIPVGSYIEEVNGQPVRFYEVANYAAGWHDNSALPGYIGNVVLAGHHNVAGRVFEHAWALEVGDYIFLDAQGRTYPYIVARKELFPESNASDAQRAENARWISQTSDERLTLVTCWPPTGNSHRVVVVAVPAK